MPLFSGARIVFDPDWRVVHVSEAALHLLHRDSGAGVVGLSRGQSVGRHGAIAQEQPPPGHLPCSRYRRWRLVDGTTHGFLLHYSAHRTGIVLEFEPAEWSLGFADQIRDGLAVADERGVLVHANQALLDLLQMPEHDVVGRPAVEVAQDLEMAPHGSPAALHGRAPHRQSSGRWEARLPDGRPSILEVRYSPWRFRGLVCGTIWTAADVTECEETRWQTAAAVWYHLTATAQHRLRNPLQTMQAAVDILRGIQPAAARPYLDLLERQLALVNDALPGRLRPAQPSPMMECRLSELVHEQIRFATFHLPTRRLRFQHERPALEPLVRVQPGPVGRAIAHLFHNSAQARADARVHVDYAWEHGAITCRVSDDGPGFRGLPAGGWLHADSGEVPRLGLAMIVSTVEAQGGTVSMTNSPWGGAQVRLHLPVALAAVSDPPPPQGIAGPADTPHAGSLALGSENRPLAGLAPAADTPEAEGRSPGANA